jgi:ABC-type protease/lipase transport system fused ATPase/permease subunit
MVRPARARYDTLADEQIIAAYDLGNRSSIIKAFARFVRLVSQIAVFGAGAFIVVRGEATAGVLIASSIIMGKALAPIEQAVSMLKIVSAAFAAGRRLRTLPPLSPPAGVEHAAGDGAPSFPGQGRIVLNDVAFHYPGRQTFAVRGIDLEIAQGQSVGIIGPNGSGKSALAGIIAGALEPKIGQATLDGVPVTRWQRTAERPPIGYLGTDPQLLEGSVHENICGFDEASALTVARAAIKAGVHELISALPEGYETKVGSEGQTLSQRERRAVALARAFYGKRRIVVLDEPELGLDAQGERRLIRHLSDLKKEGVQLVIATQQPRLLALVDKVVVLRKGTVEMFAPTEEVGKRLSGAVQETTTGRRSKVAARAATAAPRPEALQ